jgi:hypothetical protein
LPLDARALTLLDVLFVVLLADVVTAEPGHHLRAEVAASVSRHASLQAMLRTNPIKAWASGEFFDFARDRLTSTFDVPEGLRPTFRDLVDELIEWRLAEYLDRSIGQSFQCSVWNDNSQPILKLPDRHRFPDLPEGKVPIVADGRSLDAHFTNSAIDRVSAPDGDANELPGLLRGWFGADAGRLGRSESVVCERHEDGYRIRPLRRQLSAPLKILADDGTPLDATFQIEQTGTSLSVVFFSRGGTKGSAEQRNSQYNQGLELLLERMARLRLQLNEVLIDTQKVNDLLSADQRRLALEGRPYPIALADELSIPELRKLIGKAQAQVGRAPGAKGSGNSTKQIRLVVGDWNEVQPQRLSMPNSGSAQASES